MKIDDKLLIIGVVLVLAFGGGYLTLGHPAAQGGSGGSGGGGGSGGASLCPGTTSGFTQTLSPKGYDADKPGTEVALTNSFVYTADPRSGPVQLNLGGNSTLPGRTYYVFEYASNYVRDLITVTTGCVDSTVPARSTLKQIDTALTLTAKNNDGTTSNDDGANIQGIGASGSTTLHVKVSQTTAYKHLSGLDNKFVVYFNATNVTDWAPAEFSATWDNVPCVFASQGGLSNTANPSALTGVLVQQFVCTGDVSANDGSIHDLAIHVPAASGINPGNQSVGVMFTPVNWYQNSITGVLEKGAVTNAGAAIQALQGSTFWVN